VGTGEKATDGAAHDGLDQCVWMCSVFVSTNAIAVQSGGKSSRIIGRVHGACVILALLALQFTPIPMKLEGAGSSQPHVMNRGRLECCQI
jgi:hypothetical protein